MSIARPPFYHLTPPGGKTAATPYTYPSPKRSKVKYSPSSNRPSSPRLSPHHFEFCWSTPSKTAMTFSHHEDSESDITLLSHVSTIYSLYNRLYESIEQRYVLSWDEKGGLVVEKWNLILEVSLMWLFAPLWVSITAVLPKLSITHNCWLFLFKHLIKDRLTPTGGSVGQHTLLDLYALLGICRSSPFCDPSETDQWKMLVSVGGQSNNTTIKHDGGTWTELLLGA